jgi:ABC-type transport system involved in multi-copper enzyme maturation permease subunit
MGESGSKPEKRRLLREPNPLLIKEMRSRMRGARAFGLLTLYLFLLSCVASGIYFSSSQSMAITGGANTAPVGKAVFYGIGILEVFLVAFITPSLTSGAISGEKDRKTYELLRTTLLSPRRIVLGKLSSALIYTILLILAAIPLEGLAFILGGVTLVELGLAVLIMIATAISFAIIGLFFSSLVRRTRASAILTNTAVILLTVGLPLIAILIATMVDPYIYGYSSGISYPRWMEDLFLGTIYVIASLSPVGAAALTAVGIEEGGGSIWTFDIGLSMDVPASWILFVVIHLILAAVLFSATVTRVKRQETQ